MNENSDLAALDISNMSDDHVYGFGQIILQWGRYEMALGRLLGCLMNLQNGRWLI